MADTTNTTATTLCAHTRHVLRTYNYVYTCVYGDLWP